MNETTLNRIRKEYPKGTYGTVIGIDDTGDLIVRWDTGSGLKLLYGIDEFTKAERDGEVHAEL